MYPSSHASVSSPPSSADPHTTYCRVDTSPPSSNDVSSYTSSCLPLGTAAGLTCMTEPTPGTAAGAAMQRTSVSDTASAAVYVTSVSMLLPSATNAHFPKGELAKLKPVSVSSSFPPSIIDDEPSFVAAAAYVVDG